MERAFKIRIFTGVFTLLVLGALSFVYFGTPRAEVLLDSDSRLIKVPVGHALRIHFSRPMDFESVESAFEITPNLVGSFSWPDPRTLEFKPDALLNLGDRYRVRLASYAKDSWKRSLKQDLQLIFEVSGAPQVSFVTPESGLLESDQTPLTVLFDRPMDPSKGPYLKVEPETRGRLQWLGSAAFQFIPESWPLEGEFKVTLPSGLPAYDGGATEQETVLTYSVSPLKALSFRPVSGDQIFQDSSLQVTFNRPISLDAIRPGSNVLLYPSNDQDALTSPRQDGFFNTEVTYGVDEAGKTDPRALIFKPSFPYLPGQPYKLVFAEDLLGEEQRFDFDIEGVVSEDFIAASQALAPLSIEPSGDPVIIPSHVAPVFSVQAKKTGAYRLEVCRYTELTPPGVCLNSYSYRYTLLEPGKQTLNLEDVLETPFAPGLYRLKVQKDEKDASFKEVTFLVTDTLLYVEHTDQELLVWAVDAATGAPAGRLDLALYSPQGGELLTGVTDGSGLYHIQKQLPSGLFVIGKSSDPKSKRFAYSKAPELPMSVLYSDNSSTLVSRPKTFLMVDRPVQSPGDLLRVKGIHRFVSEGQLSFPKEKSVRLLLQDPSGAWVYETEVAVKREGSFDAEIPLPLSLNPGVYRLEALHASQDIVYTEQEILIHSAYPTAVQLSFENLHEFYTPKDTLKTALRAQYAFGAPLAFSKVTVSLIGSDDSILVERSGKTDDLGVFPLELSLDALNPQEAPYVLYATLETPTGDFYNQAQLFYFRGAQFHLNLQMSNRLPALHTPLKFLLSAESFKGQKIPDLPLELEISKAGEDRPLLKQVYKSVSDVLEEEIPTDGDFTAGAYQARLLSNDEAGNLAITELPFYILPSKDSNAVERGPLRLIPDHTDYLVGGKARLLVLGNPGDAVLLTFGREIHFETVVKVLSQGYAIVDLPIQSRMVPWVDVTATLLSSSRPSGESVRLGFPIHRREKTLTVSADFVSAPVPGEPATLRIHTVNFQNRPVSANVTVSAFGLSRLSDLPPAPPLLDVFYPIHKPLELMPPAYLLSPVAFDGSLKTSEAGFTEWTFILPKSGGPLGLHLMAASQDDQFGSTALSFDLPLAADALEKPVSQKSFETADLLMDALDPSLTDVNLLADFQDAQGGILPFKSAQKASPALTVRAAVLIHRAEVQGVLVEARLKDNMSFYFLDLLRDAKEASLQVQALYALAHLGQYDTSTALPLFEQRSDFSLASRAQFYFVLEALVNAGQKSVAPFAEQLRLELLEILATDEEALEIFIHALRVYQPENPALSGLQDSLQSLRRIGSAPEALKDSFYISFADSVLTLIVSKPVSFAKVHIPSSPEAQVIPVGRAVPEGFMSMETQQGDLLLVAESLQPGVYSFPLHFYVPYSQGAIRPPIRATFQGENFVSLILDSAWIDKEY